MSEIASSRPHPSGMRTDAAQRRIAAFAKRFGGAHLYLAYHAAFPLALTPDLLYRLRANFQRDIYGNALNIPWIAVADLLLSSLCEEAGYEHYEMKVAVRHELLNQLKADEKFGPQRITELSNFLIKYVRQQLDSHDPDVRDFAQAQYWTALVATRPEEAAHSIALTLSKLDARDRAEFARMRSLIEMFGEPSEEFATLLAYTRSMEQYARGDEEQAKVELERVGGKGQGVGVRGVELPVPEKLRELTEVIGEQPPSQMPTVEEIAQEVPALKDCFISYHPADYQWALWIVWQLEEAGYSVMLQPWNFEQGADFAVELDKATKVAQRIIVIYSRAYLNTLAAMPGWNSAFLQTPNLGVGLLLPIRVDDCDPDALLGPTDYLDLVGLDEQEARAAIDKFMNMHLDMMMRPLAEANREIIHTIADKPVFPGSLLGTQGVSGVSSNPCPYCGTETRPRSKFCANCGNRLPPTSPFEEAQPVGDVTAPTEVGREQLLESLVDSRKVQKESVLSEADAQANAGERIGQEFGLYRLIKKLSKDNFNETYLGQHIHSGTYVAVKIRRGRPEKEEEQKFLRDEAGILARLSHPHIIRIFDFGTQDGVIFLVLEYAPKGSLWTLYPRGEKLPLETVVTYVKQIASALQYVHDKGIIHRNVKPTNMLMKSDDSLLLSDFGLAIAVPASDATPETEGPGTPAYMAPEQIQGEPAIASDQYALAIVVYEWLTGTLPFQGSYALEIAVQHINKPPSPPEVINPTIPASVSSVVLKALAKRPGDRYGSVREFAEALEQASKPVHTKVVTPKAVTDSPSRPQYLRLDVAQLSDIGRKREHNEDNMAYVIPKDMQVMARKGALFIVADGMGEHGVGVVASEIAVDTISNAYYQDDNDDVTTSLLHAIKRANALIHQRAAENMLWSGMSTTCVAAVLRGNIAYIANVGNSRAYLVRNSQMKQISQDHSWVGERVRAGLLTEEQARTHAQRNVITRSLGTQPDVEIDIFSEPLQEGDLMVLCTDGLSGLLSDEEIRRIVEQFLPQESVYHLVERANENGGPNNITAIVIAVQEVRMERVNVRDLTPPPRRSIFNIFRQPKPPEK